MSNLVIVESPSKAKTLKNYLGNDFDVVASMGHVRDLPKARLCVDLKNDFAPKYEVLKDKKDLVKDLQKRAREADRVFLATDPDREGEAISWHLSYLLDLDLNDTNRVTFNEITKTGVKAGMSAPRKIDIDLVNAQQARRILDRIVGYTLSPFVSQKIHKGLSAGRVQSVALKMIVDKEKEIRKFVPVEFWTIDGKFKQGRSRIIKASFLGNKNGKVELKSKEETDAVLNIIDGAEFVVWSLQTGSRTKKQPAPYITSTMQQDAAARLGFKSKRTMSVAQSLYEGVDIGQEGSVGLITYMRTDSVRVSKEAVDATNEFIESTYGKNYLPKRKRAFKQSKNAQDGHEAIRPSNVTRTPESLRPFLTSDQFKLYNLIWTRFVASFMAECLQETKKVELRTYTDSAKEKYYSFVATSCSVVFDGFTKLYEMKEDGENEKALPDDLKVGETISLTELTPAQHFTQPPARYSEQTLIKALEKNGVGRPSTYASIISVIETRAYVKREKKAFVPTELGEKMSDLLSKYFPKIVETKFTATMENELDKVGLGQQDYIALLHEFYDGYEVTLKDAKEETKGLKIELEEDKTDQICPNCGKPMIVKYGRFGKFLACSGYPECKTTKPFSKPTGAVCPKCGGNVIQKRSKANKVFFGCENWPNCDFATWDIPTKEICPKCGGSLFKPKFSNKLVCLKEDCLHEEPLKKEK